MASCVKRQATRSGNIEKSLDEQPAGMIAALRVQADDCGNAGAATNLNKSSAGCACAGTRGAATPAVADFTVD